MAVKGLKCKCLYGDPSKINRPLTHSSFFSQFSMPISSSADPTYHLIHSCPVGLLECFSTCDGSITCWSDRFCSAVLESCSATRLVRGSKFATVSVIGNLWDDWEWCSIGFLHENVRSLFMLHTLLVLQCFTLLFVNDHSNYLLKPPGGGTQVY